MCKIIFYVAVFYLAIVVCHGITIREFEKQIRNKRDIPEECKPSPPSHRHHGHRGPGDGSKKMQPVCCELPDIVPAAPGAFDGCHDHGHKSGSSHGREAHNHGDKKHTKHFAEESNGGKSGPHFSEEKKECMLNCVFNASDLLTESGSLKADVLTQKLQQSIANNTKWATVVDSVSKKCIESANGQVTVPEKTCKQGAAAYVKCMSRELLFNCPSDIWVNSSECTDYKNKLEKCPNLWGPHQYHGRPKNNHREHEHKH